jgi:hypothetical protein
MNSGSISRRFSIVSPTYLPQQLLLLAGHLDAGQQSLLLIAALLQVRGALGLDQAPLQRAHRVLGIAALEIGGGVVDVLLAVVELVGGLAHAAEAGLPHLVRLALLVEPRALPQGGGEQPERRHDDEGAADLLHERLRLNELDQGGRRIFRGVHLESDGQRQERAAGQNQYAHLSRISRFRDPSVSSSAGPSTGRADRVAIHARCTAIS